MRESIHQLLSMLDRTVERMVDEDPRDENTLMVTIYLTSGAALTGDFLSYTADKGTVTLMLPESRQLVIDALHIIAIEHLEK